MVIVAKHSPHRFSVAARGLDLRYCLGIVAVCREIREFAEGLN